MSRPARPARTARPARRWTGHPGTVALAGWLFADLLLVLALVSMADRPDPPAARRTSAHPSASASAPPSASAKPPPPPSGPRAVEQSPGKFEVDGGDRADLIEQIERETKRFGDREAAFVLTFGGGTGGTGYAHRVNALLGGARPGMFTVDTATEDFLDLGARPSTARLWVYFYSPPP